MVEWKCSLMLFPDAVKEAAEVTIAHKRAAFESAWWHRTCLSKRVEGRRYVIGASQLEMAPFFFPRPPIRQLAQDRFSAGHILI